jgi:hypothetical protein
MVVSVWRLVKHIFPVYIGVLRRCLFGLCMVSS